MQYNVTLLERLLEAAHFLQLREIGAEYLRDQGYREVYVSDGWSDGGRDVRFYEAGPNPEPLAVQLTIERDWKAKVLEDARKARAKFNCRAFTLITSRRIGDVDFNRVADELYRVNGISARKVDGPAIAAAFFEHSKSSVLLGLLGIPVPETAALRTDRDVRADASLAFLFFDARPAEFRDSYRQRLLVATSSREEFRSTLELARATVHRFRLPESDLGPVDRTAIQMASSGDLVWKDSLLRPSPRLQDASNAAVALQEAKKKALRTELQRYLQTAQRRTRGRLSGLVDEILEAASALAIGGVSLDAASYVTPGASDVMRERWLNLNAVLDRARIEGAARSAMLKELTTIVSRSEYAKYLAAADLLVALQHLELSDLTAALGGRKHLQVVLDASVAIPMLASALHKPIGSRYFRAAYLALRAAQERGVELLVPDVYIEEMASHLISAARDYSAIIDDDDLRGSHNAFVSHFAWLRSGGGSADFAEYLQAFGYSKEYAKRDFYEVRDLLDNALRRLLQRYGMATVSCANRTRKLIEDTVNRIVDELGSSRPAVLRDHDVNVLTFLERGTRTTDQAVVVCTWDRLHFRAAHELGGAWEAVSPSVLADLMAMAAGELRKMVSPMMYTSALTERELERAAEIWEVIIKLEKEVMTDAEVERSARQFKDSIRSRVDGDLSTQEIAEEYRRFRGSRHIVRR